MIEKKCSMCYFRVILHPFGVPDEFVDYVSESLFDAHMDKHCSDFAFELELMNLA